MLAGARLALPGSSSPAALRSLAPTALPGSTELGTKKTTRLSYAQTAPKAATNPKRDKLFANFAKAASLQMFLEWCFARFVLPRRSQTPPTRRFARLVRPEERPSASMDRRNVPYALQDGMESRTYRTRLPGEDAQIARQVKCAVAVSASRTRKIVRAALRGITKVRKQSRCVFNVTPGHLRAQTAR